MKNEKQNMDDIDKLEMPSASKKHLYLQKRKKKPSCHSLLFQLRFCRIALSAWQILVNKKEKEMAKGRGKKEPSNFMKFITHIWWTGELPFLLVSLLGNYLKMLLENWNTNRKRMGS